MTVFLGESIKTDIRQGGEPLWRHDLLARMPPDRRAVYDGNRRASASLNESLPDTVKRCICSPPDAAGLGR